MFGKNLKKLRKEKGLTQEELAKKVQSSQKQISKFEIGFIEPNIEMLIKLANYFDVSIDYLVGRIDY